MDCALPGERRRGAGGWQGQACASYPDEVESGGASVEECHSAEDSFMALRTPP